MVLPLKPMLKGAGRPKIFDALTPDEKAVTLQRLRFVQTYRLEVPNFARKVATLCMCTPQFVSAIIREETINPRIIDEMYRLVCITKGLMDPEDELPSAYETYQSTAKATLEKLLMDARLAEKENADAFEVARKALLRLEETADNYARKCAELDRFGVQSYDAIVDNNSSAADSWVHFYSTRTQEPIRIELVKPFVPHYVGERMPPELVARIEHFQAVQQLGAPETPKQLSQSTSSPPPAEARNANGLTPQQQADLDSLILIDDEPALPADPLAALKGQFR